MAVDNTSASSGPYTANGTTTVFPFSFIAASASEVSVAVNGTPLDPALYRVTLDDTGAGSVAITPALLSGSVYVYSDPDFRQTAVFQRSGPYFPDFVNKPLDRAAIRDIYLRSELQRVLVAPVGVDLATYVKTLLGPVYQGAPGVSGVVTSYTVATLPVLSATSYALGFVTDATAVDGSTGTMAYWNGTAWKRMSDGGPIAVEYLSGLTLLGVGDSITAGAFATSNFLDLAASAFGTPAINRGYWGNSWNIDWPGTGDGSPAANHTGTLIQDVPADTAALAAVTGTAKKVIAFAGRNGLAPPNNRSAASEYADFQTWLSAMVAAGVSASTIYVCTALPATDLDESKRTAYNTLLINGAATLGYKLIRFDQDPVMGIAGAASNSTYYLDGVHPTNAGQTRLANIVLSVFGGTLPVPVLAPVNRAGTIVTGIGASGFEIVKTTVSAAWDASANDLSKLVGDFVLRFVPQQANGEIIAGVSVDPAADNSFEGILARVYFKSDGTIIVRNASTASTVSGGSYVKGDTFFIKRTGTTFSIGRGGVDGITGYTEITSFPSTSIWSFDTSFYTTGANLHVALNPTTADVGTSAPPVVGSFAPVNRAGTAVTNTSGEYEIQKTAATAAWDASANDLTALSGDFILRYTPQQNNAEVIAGISINPAADNSFASIEARIYFTASGTATVRNAGDASTTSGGSYSAGESYFIKRVGTTITLGKGGVDGVAGFTALTSFTSTSSWYFDTSLFTQNAKIRAKRLL